MKTYNEFLIESHGDSFDVEFNTMKDSQFDDFKAKGYKLWDSQGREIKLNKYNMHRSTKVTIGSNTREQAKKDLKSFHVETR